MGAPVVDISMYNANENTIKRYIDDSYGSILQALPVYSYWGYSIGKVESAISELSLALSYEGLTFKTTEVKSALTTLSVHFHNIGVYTAGSRDDLVLQNLKYFRHDLALLSTNFNGYIGRLNEATSILIGDLNSPNNGIATSTFAMHLLNETILVYSLADHVNHYLITHH